MLRSSGVLPAASFGDIDMSSQQQYHHESHRYCLMQKHHWALHHWVNFKIIPHGGMIGMATTCSCEAQASSGLAWLDQAMLDETSLWDKHFFNLG